MVPMRDGIRLATDVYRPARDGVPVAEPLPVLLQRTPYGKQGRGLVERGLYFVERGYVVVLQDTRGRYESEGTFSKYHDFDAPDGYDTVEWAAALPYTSGDVGMFGTSYGAHTQADAAKMNPPHLRALLLNQGGISRPWAHKVRNHGAFELGQQLGWGVRPAPCLARCGGAGDLRGRAGGGLVRGDAAAAGAEPARRGACVRGLRAHPDDARGRRRPRRRLPALGPHRRELAPVLRADGGRADAARRRLVRPLLRQHVRELPGSVGRRDGAAAVAGRTLDPRRQYPLVRRRRRLRAGRRAARLRGRIAPAMVRPPSQGAGDRGRRLAADPSLRDGHGRRRQGRARTPCATAATGATPRNGRCPRPSRRTITSTRTGR